MLALGLCRFIFGRFEQVGAAAMLSRACAGTCGRMIVLAGTAGGKAALVAGVSGAAAGKVKAGELLGNVAGQINGKGGGRPDMAQGGGDDGPALVAALDGVPGWIRASIAEP